MITDTHCHVISDYYDNIDNIIKSASDSNVKRIVNCGCSHKENVEILNLVEKYDSMYGAIGIHPEVVLDYKDSDLEFIKDNLNNNKIIAIGEIGLDYHYTKETRDKQIELFESQLNLASKYDIPVIVHSRDATKDVLDILKKYNLKGIIHSFSGSLEVAKEFIKMGYYLGINGTITFKNSNFKDILINIDPSYILLETDSPYLTPVPHRGEKNEPAYTKYTFEFVRNVYGMSEEELLEILEDNFNKLFNIK